MGHTKHAKFKFPVSELCIQYQLGPINKISQTPAPSCSLTVECIKECSVDFSIHFNIYGDRELDV